MLKTKNQVVQEVTSDYLETLDLTNLPDPNQIESELLESTCEHFAFENESKQKGEKWALPKVLFDEQIAMILCRCYHTRNIIASDTTSDDTYDLLGYYESEGPNKGIYMTSDIAFQRLVTKYNTSIKKKDIDEVVRMVRNMSPRQMCDTDPDTIAVNNGLFDYVKKELHDFDPDRIFLSKSKVNYNPNAKNVVIHNNEDGTDWDVESWMDSLSDDHEIVELLWQVLSAIIRPNVRWNKSAWLYSETGNNGKGTLCELMRNLCGPGSYTSIPIVDFGHEFMLEPLATSSAIIVDENDVGIFIDRAANLKAVITGDVIQINRKFRTPIACRFRGFMVQCLNEYPRIRDRSNSIYRRQLFIPMTKCFTGKERKYIKDEYLNSKDVLEYVLFKVLNTNFYTLSEPDACKATLEEYKEYNDVIRQFWDDIGDEFVWDLLPFTFLYDLYKVWFSRNVPSGTLASRNAFILDLLASLKPEDGWVCLDKKKKMWSAGRMTKSEPLILEYDLVNWQNPLASKTNPEDLCKPIPKPNYRGLIRIGTPGSSPDDDTDNSANDKTKTDETTKED